MESRVRVRVTKNKLEEEKQLTLSNLEEIPNSRSAEVQSFKPSSPLSLYLRPESRRRRPRGSFSSFCYLFFLFIKN